MTNKNDDVPPEIIKGARFTALLIKLADEYYPDRLDNGKAAAYYTKNLAIALGSQLGNLAAATNAGQEKVDEWVKDRLCTDILRHATYMLAMHDKSHPLNVRMREIERETGKPIEEVNPELLAELFFKNAGEKPN